MRAYQIHKDGSFGLTDVKMPEAGEQEVLVEVYRAGICGSDIPRIYNGEAHIRPLVPGHEFSGRVAAVGKAVDKKWIEKRVGIFPLIPCRACGPCKAGAYEMCRNYNYLGSRRDGGFAEFAAVPERNLIVLPDNISWEEGAMLEPLSVAIHAVRRTEKELVRAKNAVVCGLGTIGQMVLLILKAMGMKSIFAIGNKKIQKAAATACGIPEENYLDVQERNVEEWLQESTQGEGVDLFFECAGTQRTYQLSIESAAPGGRIVLVGNPRSIMPLTSKQYGKILRNQLCIYGSWNSSFSFLGGENDWTRAITLLKTGKIDIAPLISHHFCMEDLEKGFLIMKNKTEEYIKVMGTIHTD